MTVPLMHFGIIQLRRRELVPLWDARDQLGIAFEQGIDDLDHLPRHAPQHLLFSGVAAQPLIIRALRFDQAPIELSPHASRLLDGFGRAEKHHLLHDARPPRRQGGAIQGRARLGHRWCPAKVRFERSGGRKVVDRADGGDDRCCHHGANPWDRQQDLAFAGLLHNSADLGFQLVNVLAQQPQLSNQLRLLQHQPPLPHQIFRTNRVSGQPLQSQQIRIGRVSPLAYRLQLSQRGRCQRLWSGKALAQGQRRRRIGVFADLDQLGKEFITQSRQLVSAFGTFPDQLVAMPNQPLQLRCGSGRRNGAANQLQLIGHLDATLQLIVEVIGQRERVPFIRLEQAGWALLDMQDIDGQIQLLEILLEGTVVVPGALEDHEALLQRCQGAQPLQQQPKPLAGVLKGERWTGFKPLVALEQGGRDKARDMLGFAHINAHIEGFMRQQGNCSEHWRLLDWFGHGTSLLCFMPLASLAQRWPNQPEVPSSPAKAGGEARTRGGVTPTDRPEVPCGPHRHIRSPEYASPTEGPGVKLHYVKRGLRVRSSGERLPEVPLHLSITPPVAASRKARQCYAKAPGSSLVPEERSRKSLRSRLSMSSPTTENITGEGNG